ncbi:MAG: SCO family protein [Thermoprotei archaeon]
MRKIFIILSLIIIVLVVSASIFFNFDQSQYSLRGNQIYNPPKQAVDFRLVDQNGSVINLSDFKGKVIVLTFIYTHCPDICPVIVKHLVDAYDKLIQMGLKDQVVIVFVSVDPYGDNVTAMKEYSERFNASSLYFLTNNTAGLLTSSPSNLTDLRLVWNSYNIYVQINKTSIEEGWYEVDHTTVVYIIDKNFRLRAALFGVPPLWSTDDVVYDVNILIKL